MPDLLIFTGSDAAKAVTANKRLDSREITVDFITKQYHNGVSTRGENEEIFDFCCLDFICGSFCTARL